MSRSKKNHDHLVDFRGNYKQDLQDLMQGAFCSFASGDVGNFYASHNISSIDKDSPGHFIISFKNPFPSDKYNVIVSCNSGFYRHHHAVTHPTYVDLTVRDSNNNPVNDAFVTMYCFTSLPVL